MRTSGARDLSLHNKSFRGLVVTGVDELTAVNLAIGQELVARDSIIPSSMKALLRDCQLCRDLSGDLGS